MIDKEGIRKAILDRRGRLKEKEMKEKSLSIGNRLFEMEEFAGATRIMFYLSFSSEVRTFDMIKRAIEGGKRVFVPYVVDDGMDFAEIKKLDDDLRSNRWGILEPRDELRIGLSGEILEVIIVPGVAFDRGFRRLGYGRGYYDRFLGLFLKMRKERPVFIGLCYELQIVNYLPGNSQDVKMDKVVTESQVLER